MDLESLKVDIEEVLSHYFTHFVLKEVCKEEIMKVIEKHLEAGE